MLNANYVRACAERSDVAAVRRPALHARGAVRRHWLEGTGVTTLDFAKAMIDEGYHPMTMYFPLVVHGAMLIEPTESESKASLDLFIAALRDLAMAAKRGDTARFSGAPYYAPRRRLDETRAAREPVLRWTPASADRRSGGVARLYPSPRRGRVVAEGDRVGSDGERDRSSAAEDDDPAGGQAVGPSPVMASTGIPFSAPIATRCLHRAISYA